MKYRKKPVVIEAYQWFYDDCESYPNWIHEALYKKSDEPGYMYYLHSSEQWKIVTLEGVHIVSDGDYIIKGVKGEIYPCKPDIFEMTYEKV